ncbi:unnamed protein product [Brassicogethes aeneus]|uniref:Uncharacterized protein n=1 Tax=Brassicogethes aeneus TaxID=1431903 RepID=A0A9P0BG10_BRAAE|nr:unnamed protein product [Brassicogethes aeneus]
MLSKLIIVASLLAIVVRCAPQSLIRPIRPYDDQSAPTPYDFNYKVDNAPTNTYFGQNEAADPAGRVVGQYYVYLPDGRLMTVDYTVDGESGFVPRISFQNQAPIPSPIAPIRG